MTFGRLSLRRRDRLIGLYQPTGRRLLLEDVAAAQFAAGGFT